MYFSRLSDLARTRSSSRATCCSMVRRAWGSSPRRPSRSRSSRENDASLFSSGSRSSRVPRSSGSIASSSAARPFWSGNRLVLAMLGSPRDIHPARSLSVVGPVLQAAQPFLERSSVLDFSFAGRGRSGRGSGAALEIGGAGCSSRSNSLFQLGDAHVHVVLLPAMQSPAPVPEVPGKGRWAGSSPSSSPSGARKGDSGAPAAASAPGWPATA